ncbi:MAG: hypothetical protein P1P93_00320 [Gammaproteobacteria bacterium]|nr:hypothetical protein [Gammaproteobacteria bacterium]
MVNIITDPGDNTTTLAGVIAIVGCDGTGKSTLTADLLSTLNNEQPTVKRYLGLVSGEVGDKIKNLPLIGVQLERYLAAKAFRAQDMRKKIPGTGTALIMHFLSLWRAMHLLFLRRLSRKGIQVIVDRYPQAEISGFRYDGPGITASDSDSWLLRTLAMREQALYNWMATYKPAIVLRLNIDAETAFARKPDHDINELRDKISIMPRLNYNGASIVDIDTTVPYQQVLTTALLAIKNCQ